MKQLLFIFVVLCITLILLRKKHESFKNYILTKSQFSVNKLYFYVNTQNYNDKVLHSEITKLFPFNDPKAINKNMNLLKNKNITKLNKMCMQTPMIILDNIYNPTYKSVFDTIFKNIGFLFNLDKHYLTLILPLRSPITETSEYSTWNNKKIGILADHFSLVVFEIIDKIFNLKTNILPMNDWNDIIQSWEKKQIDGIFTMTSHPNKQIELFSFQNEISIFNFPKFFNNNFQFLNTVKFTFPSLLKGKIPLYSYRVFSDLKIMDGCCSYMSFVANQDIHENTIYAFTSTVFKNFFYLQTKLNFLESFNLSSFNLCPVNLQYHPGSRKFFTEQNIITTNKNALCKYSNQFCDEKQSKNINILLHRGYV